MDNIAAKQFAQDDELDLLQLCLYVLKKWKILVILCVVGALLGGGYAYTSMQSKSLDKMVAYFESNGSSLESENFSQYYSYKDLYDSRVLYEKQSVLMNLDQNSVYSGTITIVVNSGLEYIPTIENNFINQFEKDGVFTEIAQRSGLNTTESSVRELVYGEFSLSNSSTVAAAPAQQGSANGTYTLTVVAPTKEALNNILDAVSSITRETDTYLKGLINGYSSEILVSGSTFGYSDVVAEAKLKANEIKADYITKMSAAAKALSSDEKLYGKYLYDHENFMNSYRVSLDKKFVVLGAFALACLGAAFYAVKFLMDTSVKTKQEFMDKYGLKVLASVPGNDGKYIKSLLCAAGNGPVLICMDNDIDDAVKESFCALVSDAENISAVGSLTSDSSAVDMSAGADKIVLLTQLWKTKRDSIIQQCILAESMGKNVFGVIVMK